MKIQRYIKKWIGLCLVLCVGCLHLPKVSANQEPLRIVTSFYPMYAITAEIVGDLHQVQMINSSNGIHGYEPSAADVAAIYDADIFIYHSTTLESWTKNLAANMGDHQVKMIQASEGLELLKVPGLEDVEPIEGKDESNLYDPHSWLDPIEAGREAEMIAKALAEVDPANEATYMERADAFNEKAQALVDKYQPIFDQLDQKTFVTQHTAFYYLAERFGLTQLGISGINSDAEPSARQIAEVMAFVDQYQVKTIFIEPNVSDRIAQTIADKTGVAMVIMSPLESDPRNELTFLDNLTEQLDILSKHMSSEE